MPRRPRTTVHAAPCMAVDHPFMASSAPHSSGFEQRLRLSPTSIIHPVACDAGRTWRAEAIKGSDASGWHPLRASCEAYISELTGRAEVVGPGEPHSLEFNPRRVKISADASGNIDAFNFG